MASSEVRVVDRKEKLHNYTLPDETDVWMELYGNKMPLFGRNLKFPFVSFSPHTHAKNKKYSDTCSGDRVSGCAGMGAGIGLESVQQETTGCESQTNTQTQKNKADAQNYNIREHSKHTQSIPAPLFLSLSVLKSTLTCSPWRLRCGLLSERASERKARGDKLSARMRERRRGIKGKGLRSLSCLRVWLDLM